MDGEIQKMKWLDESTKYISFKHSKLSTRLGALYLNSMNNIPAKYKFLTNCSVYDGV